MDGRARSPEIPGEDEGVHGACGQKLRVRGVEIDICDGPGVAVENVLDGVVGRPGEVPDHGLLVRRGDDPAGLRAVGGPLHVGHLPLGLVVEPPGSRERIVQVDDK